MSLSFRQGDATVKLSGDLSAMVRARVEAQYPALLSAMERPAQAIAAEARSEWYGARGVDRVTGLGGDIEVVTTLDGSRGTLTVAIGSTDKRVAGNQRRTPIPSVQHSPGRTALVYVQVTPEEYWRTPGKLRGPFTLDKLPSQFVADLAARGIKAGPLVRRQPENAGTGHGYLLGALVVRPARAAYEAGGTAIAAIAAALGGDRG